MNKIRNLNIWSATSMFLLGMVCAAGAAGTIYVDADAPGPTHDGSTWANGYRYLQDALAVAVSGDEIWVAKGIYKPDQGARVTAGDRYATFQLKNGVALYGGFAGSETSIDERRWQTNENILSGDIGTLGSTGDNSYHVVTGSGTDGTALLDGFTITAGKANSLNPYNSGAGMYNDNGNPAVVNCTFSGNWAGYFGAGMFNDNSSPGLTNCIFSGNTVAGGGGGGMQNYGGSPTLTNCTFSGNWAGWGGGMYNEDCSPGLTNCTFSGNWAAYGGGMENDCSSPTLTNCTFSGNSANNGGGIINAVSSGPSLTNCAFSGNSSSYSGGGMSNVYFSSPTLTNCTFSGNSAPHGNALACDSYEKWLPSTLEVANSILWDGGDEIWNNDGSTIAITYSDVRGGWTGEGNISADPMFVGAGDYHLQDGSPCIDAGTNSAPALPDTDKDGNLRIVGAAVDMGAYEWQGPSVITVAIDIKPGSYPNAINLGSYGLIPVAILSDQQFDATTVDAETVELAGAGVAVRGRANKYMAHSEDVNGDGLLDLVVQVGTENLDAGSLQDGYAILTGKTYGGVPIEGKDEIIIVPPEK